MKPKPASIDAYLATVGGARRTALDRLRKTIRKIVPEAEECISYRMPAFRLDGKVVAGFMATAKGCSYYPFSGQTLETLARELKGMDMTQGSLHFDPKKPLSASLVRKLIKARIAEGKLVLKKASPKSKPSQMKSYESFDRWAEDQDPKHRKLIRVLRRLVNKTAPGLTETVKWGNGCWAGKEWPVIYIFGGYETLQFGFFGGSYLSDADPKRLLKGNGKFVRHIPVQTLRDIDETAFKRLIRKAAQNEREQ